MFKTGEFHKYTTSTDISLGDIGSNGMTLTAGAVVEFDGATMKWGAQTYHYPKLALGIKAGWVVPYREGGQVAAHRPKPAGVQVHAAQTTGENKGEPLNVETAMEDEQVAGSLSQANARREASRQAKTAGAPPAVDVTPDMSTAPSAVDATPPGMGRGDDKVVNATPPSGSIDAPDENPTQLAPTKKRFPLVGAQGSVDEQDGVPVARVGSAKHRTVLKDKGQADQEFRQITERGPVRTQKVASEAPPPEPEPDPMGIEIPEAEAPEEKFDWQIEGVHWQKRVKLAIENYGDKPDILKKIMAVETPGVVKALRAFMAKRAVDQAGA